MSISLMAPSRDLVAEVPQAPKDIASLKIAKDRREKERREKDREIIVTRGDKPISKIR